MGGSGKIAQKYEKDGLLYSMAITVYKPVRSTKFWQTLANSGLRKRLDELMDPNGHFAFYRPA